MNAPKQITVRNPAPELTRRLKALAESRGESMNTTILRLLSEAVGIHERRSRLETYVTWTDADRKEFEDGLRAQRVVDPGQWR